MVNNRKLVVVTINFCDLVGARQGSAWDYFAEKGRHDAFNLPKKQLMECGFTVKLPRSWVLFPTILAYIWLFLVFQCLFYFHASSAFQGYCECHCRKEWGDRNEFPVFLCFQSFQRIWTVTGLNYFSLMAPTYKYFTEEPKVLTLLVCILSLVDFLFFS